MRVSANSFYSRRYPNNNVSFQKDFAAYVCSPLASGFVETAEIPTIRDFILGNMERAIGYAQKIAEKGDFPYWNHSTWPRFIDDTKPEQRIFALEGCIDLLKRCDFLVWFTKEPKGGMIKEIAAAKKFGIPVFSEDEYLSLTGTELERIVKDSTGYKMKENAGLFKK